LRELYRGEGRWRTAISSKTSEDGRGVAVTFVIAEGEVNKVATIGFTGNRAFTAAQLRDVITTTQSGWLDILKTNLTYDPERVAVDRLLLLRHYQSRGYADAKIGEAKVETDPATGSFSIVFQIEEGERFTFASPTIESRVSEVKVAGLEDTLTTRAGDTYKVDRIEASTEALTTALAVSGHPFTRVAPQIERDEAARTVRVVYRIEDGPRIFIRRIEITGNVRTRDHVVRRELRIVDGDPFTPALVQAAKKRLMGTGFFKSVEIQPAKTPEPDSVDLKVALVEQETAELSFGIGYSMTDGVVGDISFADRNVLGSGYAMRVKLEAGQKRYGGEIGFTDPHFLDSSVAAGFDLFYRDVDRTTQSSYKQQRYGGTLRLGIPVTDTLGTGLSYTFTQNRLYEVGANASPAIKEAAAIAGGTYATSAIGTSTTYDTRDSRKSPTSGIVATTANDFAGLGGDARFVRTTADVRAYVPLIDGVTFVGHIGGGTIGGWGGQDVRLLDLFYKGGETVRGFATAGLGPRDILSANKDALGGKSYYVTSAEVRTPMPFVPPALGLSAMAFADAGSVFGANATAAKLPGLSGNSAMPRASTGVGLVWDSPVGPLQASYGFALAQQPGDKVQPFNFGLGSGF
jgi:outer membrane protein insertion porin family